MHTSQFTPGVTPQDEEWSWVTGPANVMAYSPLGRYLLHLVKPIPEV